MRPTPSVHWLRENANERSPHRLLVVDTETRIADPADPERQTLRLWAATLIRRHNIDPSKPRRELYRGHTADELADLVERLARADAALWMLTHNLNFDLSVTELPVLLTERGWHITESALTTDDPWCRLAKVSKRLTIVDSWSYMPAGVEAIGELIGQRKAPLPPNDAPEAEWWIRCERDVSIVVDALVSLLDWWDAGHYGNWSITGPATGWSSYRHRRPKPRVLVDPDENARRLEARAITGGRRDVRVVGKLPAGLYADLDMATAHLTVMSECPLPSRRMRRFASLPLDDHHLESGILDVLAECELETETPRYPWDSGRGVFFPVGRFRTVLAGPEIREARRRGELRAIGAGYTYLLSDHMRDWARWTASLLDESNTTVPPAARLLAKHWSRCVPGKWAGHTSDVISRIPDPRPGWSVERGWLMPERRPADFLRIGYEQWTIARDLWADDAFPAILAWIQAWTRVSLSRMLDTLGGSVISANTDGALVDVRALARQVRSPDDPPITTVQTELDWLHWYTDELDQTTTPFTIRIKGACRKVTVLSPQHHILDGKLRLAGIPRKAQRLANGRYRFTQWPKLRVQLQRDDGPGYRTRTAEPDVSHIPPTGWLLNDGRVRPIHVELGDDGRARVQPWSADPAALSQLADRTRQHPLLRPLLPRQAAKDPGDE